MSEPPVREAGGDAFKSFGDRQGDWFDGAVGLFNG